MNQNGLIYGIVSALAVALVLFLIKDFHDKVEEIESRLDFAAGYEQAESDNVKTKTPCGCGGH
jgi:hypothetical protein